MLNEDQVLVKWHVKDAVISLDKSWKWAASIYSSHIRLFLDKEHKESEEAKGEELRNKYMQLIAAEDKKLSLVEELQRDIINKSETIEDVKKHIDQVMGDLMKFDWNTPLDIKKQVLSNLLQKTETCDECKKPLPITSLYSIYQDKRGGGHYCMDCVEVVYDTLFPYCVMCERRYELVANMIFCKTCHQNKKAVKEWGRVKSHLERAKQCGAATSLTLKQWVTTLDHFNWSCAYCGDKFQALEHYIPLPFAGTTVTNCLPSCTPCNMRKRDKHPEKLIGLFPSDNLARIQAYLQSQKTA